MQDKETYTTQKMSEYIPLIYNLLADSYHTSSKRNQQTYQFAIALMHLLFQIYVIDSADKKRFEETGLVSLMHSCHCLHADNSL